MKVYIAKRHDYDVITDIRALVKVNRTAENKLANYYVTIITVLLVIMFNKNCVKVYFFSFSLAER